MLELYGRQWEASYGHVDGEAFPAWCEGLALFSPRQIKNGLEALVREGSEYPPNLIKFCRLCRSGDHTTAQNHKPKLAGPRPLFSVMRVERAKQKALLGEAFPITAIDQSRLEKDWTDQDETQLQDLIAQWDSSTGLKGLNDLIDHHQFSGGTHYSKAHRRAARGGFD